MIVLSSSANVVPVGWQVESLDWAITLPLAYVICSESSTGLVVVLTRRFQDRGGMSYTLSCETVFVPIVSPSPSRVLTLTLTLTLTDRAQPVAYDILVLIRGPLDVVSFFFRGNSAWLDFFMCGVRPGRFATTSG